MKTNKIILEEPFKSIWRFGYLRVSNENRKIVDLYNSDAHRTTISYARYLMSVKVGHFISKEFEVDHINDDKTDDRPENLQIVTKKYNNLKRIFKIKTKDEIHHCVECMNCGTHFLISNQIFNFKSKTNNPNIFCSKSCSTKYNAFIGTIKIGKPLNFATIEKIKDLNEKGLLKSKIAKLLNISIPTVTKYTL